MAETYYPVILSRPKVGPMKRKVIRQEFASSAEATEVAKSKLQGPGDFAAASTKAKAEKMLADEKVPSVELWEG